MRGMFARRATPFRLAVHYFHRTYQNPPANSSWLDLFKLVTSERLAREGEQSKMFAYLVTIMLALAISGPTPVLDVKTSWIDLSLPKVYVTFLLSATFGLSILQGVGTMFMVEIQRRIANKVNRNGWSALLSLPYASGSSWTAIFSAPYTIIASPLPLVWAQWVLLTLILAPAAFIYGGAFWLGANQIVAALTATQPIFMGAFFAILSVFFFVLPPILAVLAVIPMSLSRNVSAIRWNLLYRVLYKPFGRSAPASWATK